MLATSPLPIHLMHVHPKERPIRLQSIPPDDTDAADDRYNSADLQSLSSNVCTMAVVQDSFLDGAPFNLATAEHNGRGGATRGTKGVGTRPITIRVPCRA